MTVRSKWDITIDDEKGVYEKEINQSGIDRQAILELLDNDSLTTHFQPVFSAKDGSVYGYEALTRIKEDKNSTNIGDLFKKAIQTNIISSLDVQCRENAIKLSC